MKKQQRQVVFQKVVVPNYKIAFIVACVALGFTNLLTLYYLADKPTPPVNSVSATYLAVTIDDKEYSGLINGALTPKSK